MFHNRMRIGMRTRKDLMGDMHLLKKELSTLKNKEAEMEAFIKEQSKTDETSSNLLTLLKYMIDENKATRQLLKHIADSVERLEMDMGDLEYQSDELVVAEQQQPAAAKPILGLSEKERKIIQFIQGRKDEIACADDVKAFMNYRGRSGVCTRLKKFEMMGLLKRIQIGKRVYYKYDAGKATDVLIVSPPQ